MVLKGYKQPLVQEDMWELSEADGTAYINQRFQHFMESDLGAARVRFQNRLKKKCVERGDKAQEEPFQNGLSNGLGKGVSQDVLMMVRMCREIYLTRTCTTHFLALQIDFILSSAIDYLSGSPDLFLLKIENINLCLKAMFKQYFSSGGKGKERR